MVDTMDKMGILKAAVPNSFKTAKVNYLTEIDSRQNLIQEEFQKTLNGGFGQVYSTVAIASALAFLFLLFYRSKKKENEIL